MDDIEARARDIIAEYGDLTTGEEAQIQEFKQAVQDFLKNGPACRSSAARPCSST
jgi:hypothetical protein